MELKNNTRVEKIINAKMRIDMFNILFNLKSQIINELKIIFILR